MKQILLTVISIIIVTTVPLRSQAASPGGISSDLNAWFKADKGVTVNGSNDVLFWGDQSGLSNNSTSVYSNPNLQANGLNNNPIIDFDGNDYINLPDNTLTSGTGGYTGFVVAAVDSSAWHPIASGGNEATDRRFWIGASDSYRLTDAWWGSDNDLHTASNTLSTGTYFLASYIYDTSFGRTIYKNSQTMATDSSNDRNHGSGSNRIGARPNLTEIMNGKVAEIIIYNATLSDTSRRRVESYLAIKYGFTLQSGVNYVDSTGAVIYPSTTSFAGYTNDIAGIGRDDTSALGQVLSRSNSSDALITIGAENEGTNTTPVWNDIADREFLCWGNDNGNITSWTTTNAPVNAERLTRVWRVSEPNGDVGLVTVKVNNGEIPSGVVNELILYVDNDTDFTSGATPYIMSNTSGIWSVNINFSNYNYFTLGYSTFRGSPTNTPTITLTATPTRTMTPSVSVTSTITKTVTLTPTRSVTYTPTLTSTLTPTITKTSTPNIAAPDMEKVKVYPNPFRNDLNVRHEITFFNLPARATIRLYSVDGKLINTLEKDDSGNRFTWRLTNQQGQSVSSGIYIYLIHSNGSQRKGKLAILQ